MRNGRLFSLGQGGKLQEKVIEIIIMESISISMFAFAYAIGVKKKMNLIAGYNKKTADNVTDKDALARLVGRVCLLVGVAAVFMPLAKYIWGETSRGWAMVADHFGGFNRGVVALTMLQSREYVTSGSNRKEKR